jgi:integrase
VNALIASAASLSDPSNSSALGAPVSIYTVSRELGHTSPAMVQRVYAHLGTIRHRAEVVEYRVEQHAGTLGDRLTALQRLGL